MTKLIIGVIFGGSSGEHEVSIKSAQTVIQALKTGLNQEKFEVIAIYIDKNGLWWPPSVANNIIKTGKAINKNDINDDSNSIIKSSSFIPEEGEKVDIWYPVLHGPNGEDGTIQGLFKLTGKPFIGSGVLGSAIGMDKISMKAVFKAAKLPQVPYIGFDEDELSEQTLLTSNIQRIEKYLGYPCFIKPANLGSSVGITKAYSKEHIISGIELAKSLDSRIIVEKNVDARELECAVLGKKKMEASVVGEVKFESDWYDFETKYINGSNNISIPANISDQLSKDIRHLSLKACKAINVYGMARVDFFFEEVTDQIWINEINTLPGFTKQSMYPMLWEASGLNIENLVAKIVKTAQE